MAATVDALKVHLGLDPASTADEDAMAAAVAAANDAVSKLRPDWTVVPQGRAAWEVSADEAAVLLAARFYGRRGSVAGVVGFADFGAVSLGRLDPDVRLLLELGEYQRPVIA